ncbi:tetraspanin-19-like [Mya arenaria]|uniref:tetraspanin-19-like n=1 Tax=Mya arenaria TaxID=6604 RepID=UPI0022E717BC|nr:tetraspanin-19-like [Mya arenaria]
MAKNPLSCGQQCTRVTLIALNVLFLLCGIALFVVGLVFRFGGNGLKEEIKPAFENIEINGYEFYDLVNSLAIIFIVAGAVVIVFSFLGFVGAACYVRGALVVYAVLICLALALELAGVILFFVLKNDFEKALKIGMQESIQRANEGDSDYRKGTEYLFESFECCHVSQERHNYTEGNSAQDVCNTASNTYQVDCYDAFTDWLKNYQGALVGVGIAVIIIELLCVILSCWLCRVITKRSSELV